MNGPTVALCDYDTEQMMERRANACDLLGSMAGHLGRMLGDDDTYGESFTEWATQLEVHAAWLRGEGSAPAVVSEMRLVR